MNSQTGPVLAEGERLGIVGGGTMVKALVFPLLEKGGLSYIFFIAARYLMTIVTFPKRSIHHLKTD